MNKLSEEEIIDKLEKIVANYDEIFNYNINEKIDLIQRSTRPIPKGKRK